MIVKFIFKYYFLTYDFYSVHLTKKKFVYKDFSKPLKL